MELTVHFTAQSQKGMSVMELWCSGIQTQRPLNVIHNSLSLFLNDSELYLVLLKDERSHVVLTGLLVGLACSG